MNAYKINASLKLLSALTLAAAGLSGSAEAAPGTTVNVNFALTGAGDEMNGKAFIEGTFQQAPSYYSGTTWNDHVGPTIIDHSSEPGASFTQVNALDSDGNVTTIGYTTASTTTQFDFEGPYTWLDHPDTRMLNGGVRRVWNSGSGNLAYPSHNRLTISGLDPAKVYNIYLASSQDPDVKCSWWVGTTGTQQFINNTTSIRTSQTWRPGDNWVVFYAVAPDAGGNIDVRGRGEAFPDGGGAFSGLTLNGFQILEATGWLNPDKAIYDFGDPANNPGTSSSISDNNTGNNITWNVAFSANLSALSPTFTLADFATCLPVSGSTQDFSGGPVAYTVTAQDGSTRVYQVTADPADTPNTNAEMLSFEWGAFSASINGTNVSLSVPPGTDVTTLNPTFTLFTGATASPLSGSTQDFTTPVNYTVTAEDGVTTQVYTVSVYQPYSWVNAAGGTWSTAANWDPVAVPPSAFGTALTFDTAGTYTASNDVADPFELGLLSFGNTARVTLDGQSLSLGGAGALVTQASSNPTVVGNAVNLAADTTIETTGNGLLTIAGVISGGGGLTKTGSSILSLNAVNTHSGGTTIAAGTLTIGVANLVDPLGSGMTTVNSGGTLGLSRTTFTGPLTLNGGTVTAGNSFTSNINGPLLLDATSTISVTGNLTIAGDISGAGGLTKAGSAFVPLNGASNDYTGPTTIGVNGGGLTVKSSLYGNDTAKWIPENITVNSGGALVLNVGGPGEFTIAQAGTMFSQLGGVVNDNGLRAGSIFGVDTRTSGGTFTITDDLIDSSGPGGGAVGFRYVGNGNLGASTMELTGNNTYSGLTIVDRNGTIKVSSLNSVNGGSPPLASSSLGRPTTDANGTIQLGSNVSFQGGSLIYTGPGETTDRVINLGGANGTTYRLDQSGSGLLKFTSPFTITDNRGIKTIVLQGSTAGKGEIASGLPLGQVTNPNQLTKAGTGTWTLSGDNLYTGITSVNEGELALVGGSQSSAITVNNGAFLGFTLGAPTTSIAAVTLQAGAKIRITGTPVLPANYTLLTTTSSIAGIPVLETPIPDYELVVQGGNVLVLKSIVVSPYKTWVSTFPTLTDSEPTLDFDGGGLQTGTEWVLGGDPTLGSDDAGVAPTSEENGSGLVFTFRRADLANDDPATTIEVVYSTDLVSWTAAEDGVDGVTIVATDNFFDTGIDRVVATLPAALGADGRLFARLRVSGLPGTLLSEDFEGGNGGFTVSTASGTAWEFGNPNSPDLLGGAVIGGNSGTGAWGTNLTGAYGASTDTKLHSPVIDLTGVGTATLSFAQSLDIQSPHTLVVNVIEEATDTVLQAAVHTSTPDPDTNSSPWATVSGIAIVGGQKVRIEWHFTGNGDGNYNGAYIDDVVVETP